MTRLKASCEARLILAGTLPELSTALAGPTTAARLLEGALVALAARAAGTPAPSDPEPEARVAAAMEVLETVVDRSDTSGSLNQPADRARERAEPVTGSDNLPPGFRVCGGDAGDEALRQLIDDARAAGRIEGSHREAAGALEQALGEAIGELPQLDRYGLCAVAFAELGLRSGTAAALGRVATAAVLSPPRSSSGVDSEPWSTLGTEAAEVEWGLPVGTVGNLGPAGAGALLSLTIRARRAGDEPGWVRTVIAADAEDRIGLLLAQAKSEGLLEGE